MTADIIALPTLDELIEGAICHGSVVNIAHSADREDDSDLLQAAEGVQRAIEDWMHDTRLPQKVIPRALTDVAIQRVLQAGWLAREDLNHEGYRANFPITDGAARYEMLEWV